MYVCLIKGAPDGCSPNVLMLFEIGNGYVKGLKHCFLSFLFCEHLLTHQIIN